LPEASVLSSSSSKAATYSLNICLSLHVAESVFVLTDAAFCLTTGLYKAEREEKSVTSICIMRGKSVVATFNAWS